MQLQETISAYQPGQSNVDGGGFQIVKSDPKQGYMYAQFEALKGGYIDDVEFAYIDGLGDHVVQVRSSSRLHDLTTNNSGTSEGNLVDIHVG